MERQDLLRTGKLHPGKGIFALERYISYDTILRAGFKMLGMANQGRRNFLDVRVVERNCFIPRLPKIFEGFRLLHLSDLHLDLDPGLLPVLKTLLPTLSHDAAVVTGDFREGTRRDWGEAIRMTSELMPYLSSSRWAVLGNHDLLEMVPDLEEAGLPFLMNEAISITRQRQRIWIAGVDDAHLFESHDLSRARARILEGECSILLSHTPEIAEEAACHGFDLMLSGHTHAGQICLPGGRAIAVPAKGLPKERVGGFWKLDSMYGFTSPGTGSCGVAARFNCPPEITLHILTRA